LLALFIENINSQAEQTFLSKGRTSDVQDANPITQPNGQAKTNNLRQ